MDPARRWTNAFADCSRERDDVVLGDLLDLLYTVDAESGAGADLARRLLRHDPGTGHRIDRGQLDLQPSLVFPLVAPDATHFRVRVPRYHPSDNRSGGMLSPFTAPRTVAASAPSFSRSRATRCTSSRVTRSTPSSVSSSPNCRSK